MEDSRIVELYFERNEQAIAESDAKYGRMCMQIALNILNNGQDAEECVNDTYLRAWNAIPPDRPIKLGAYLSKITRHLSLDRYKASHAAKRGSGVFVVSLDELNECVPAGSMGFGSGFDDELEARRIGECINRFLKKSRAEIRDVFICRYFFGESISEIARRFGLSESKIKSMLYRTREKLRRALESEGIRL